ncbi:MAG: DUF1684 domain-containing protein [Anaerolineae bacterium]|nr:DUF1684 domain-containing protein [Anaerolineae bacterium]
MTITYHQPALVARSQFETLLDYRRSVSDLYGRLRSSNLTLRERCDQFRRDRDLLFQHHPQSALTETQKAGFAGLQYYPYNPAWRFVLPLDTNVVTEVTEMELKDEGITRLQRFGQVHFDVAGQTVTLSLYWILGYGGGVFLPFRDLTHQTTTYGGGRYLLDTIKHADLGQDGSCLIIDFNYAYNPSCAYNPAWNCPLAPRENWLPVAVLAGEQRYNVA